MPLINENFLNLQGSYLFAKISKKVAEFKEQNPNADIIRLGIGDVTRPLPLSAIKAMHEAIDEMANESSFKGYGPEQGYDFLRQKIKEYDYAKRGVSIGIDEIFISDGAKSDTANIQELFSVKNKIALTDPVYPVYCDTNVMAGRSGKINQKGQYKNFVYLPCVKENNFNPALPKEKVDLIYLCFPNNPTGASLKKKDLKKWVDYAKKNKALILFDSAYEAFISEPDVLHSIYEIEGAKDVAIEFRSFSKTAGFTGMRCGYTVVPKTVYGCDKKGKKYSLNEFWLRRQTTKFNGASYIIQRGAAALFTEQGQREIKELINFYMTNAKIIREGLTSIGLNVFGGVNAPYIWLQTPNHMDSWKFFDKLLKEIHVVGTPGIGFGLSGQGYFRLTGFGTRENTKRAVERFKKLKI